MISNTQKMLWSAIVVVTGVALAIVALPLKALAGVQTHQISADSDLDSNCNECSCTKT